MKDKVGQKKITGRKAKWVKKGKMREGKGGGKEGVVNKGGGKDKRCKNMERKSGEERRKNNTGQEDLVENEGGKRVLKKREKQKM